MQCYHCEKDISKSWLHLQNVSVEEEGITSNVDKHICGYSCYKRLIENDILPKNLWSHTVNKSDYDGLIRPVMKQTKKNFEYLTLNEIWELKESCRKRYYEEKDKQIEINPELAIFREELEQEEYRTSCVEGSSESEYSDQDDY
jgi:hypothetical protein